MTHQEIRGLLADHALGRLGQRERAAIDEHLAGCSACRGWLTTYDLLGRSLGRPTPLEHPDAAELAGWAVLHAADLPAEATAHLEACPACRRELDLLGAALTAARGDLPDAEAEPRRLARRRKPRAAAWAAAAAVALAVVAGWILLAPRSELDRERVIAGGHLTGNATISARSIYAANVEIASGSNIILEVGDMVTLGEGFVVASGATFAAGAVGSPGR